MAHIFQEMSPGMVTMASTDKNILVYDVSSLKTGIFYIQTCLWTKMSILDLQASRNTYNEAHKSFNSRPKRLDKKGDDALSTTLWEF